MPGDRAVDAEAGAIADRREPIDPVATGGAVSGDSAAAIAAVAGALRDGPVAVAAALRRFPGRQDAMLRWLHAQRGNAYVQAVLAERAPRSPAHPERAEQRDQSPAADRARQIAATGGASVEHYRDMLAAVLAAQVLTDGASRDDADALAQVTRLLQPVARRLDQLNDHQGRLAKFGAGNIAGQTALDMAETAVQSWLRRIALGARVQTDELVMRFRAGAEPIQFLTGERADAPTLRAFDRASRSVGLGAAALALGPGLTALAAEEAGLLAFAGRVAAQRVALWAITNPAAALAVSEALVGFGVQIGEDGWEGFWSQLHDPQGRWLVVAQVLMDCLLIRSGMSAHDERVAVAPPRAVSTAPGADPAAASNAPGARRRLEELRAVLQRVHDAAAVGERSEQNEGGAARQGSVSHEPTATHDRSATSPSAAAQEPSAAHASSAMREPSAAHASSAHEPSATQASLAAHERSGTREAAAVRGSSRPGAVHGVAQDEHELRALLPADLAEVPVIRSAELRGTDVVVRYHRGAVQIEAGPHATARHVGYHAAAARRLLRFQGPLGLARRLVDSIRTKLRLTPGYGTAGFEGRAEVAKLLEIERELVALRARLETGDAVLDAGRALDARAVDAELVQVQDQLEAEAARIDSYDPGKGFVAARALPEYPVALDAIEAIVTEEGGRFEVEFVSRTKEGKTIILGTGYVDVAPNGQPKGHPEFTLGNYADYQGVEHKVKLYPAVIEGGAGQVPLPEGKQTSVTRYVIDRFIQRYTGRFGKEPAALGGSLGFENKRNFQIEFIKCIRRGLGEHAAAKAAASKISYGDHRIAAGYSELEVDTGSRTSWVWLDLNDGTGKHEVPSKIEIVGRRP
jgi:hypothetical protein